MFKKLLAKLVGLIDVSQILDLNLDLAKDVKLKKEDFQLLPKPSRVKKKQLSPTTFGDTVQAAKLAELIKPHSPDSRHISRILCKFNYRAKCLKAVDDLTVRSNLLHMLYNESLMYIGGIETSEMYYLTRCVLRQNYKKAKNCLGL